MVHVQSGNWHEAAGEVLCGGYATLHGVGVEVYFVNRRHVVLLEQSLFNGPFAEELPHLRLKYTAPEGQFARCG